MNEQLNFGRRIIFTAIVGLLSWAHVTWDYFHGGVPIHRLLHSADMPGFSNWWGVIVIPLLTWFLLIRINRKVSGESAIEGSHNISNVFYGFLGALIFGIVLSILFTIGSDVPEYMMMGLIVMSFFVPLFRAELFLGFFLGMVYTFGAILPIIFGIIVLLLSLLAYKVVRTAVLSLVSKITSGKS